MDVFAYQTDIYGEFGGLLNRLDVPRDRLSVSWDLRRKGRRPEFDLQKWLTPERCVMEIERVKVRGKGGPIEIEAIREAQPALNRNPLFVEIPADFYLMLRETDVEDENVRKIPVDWRIKTRQVFQTLLGKGYKVSDFCLTESTPRRCFYVLKRTRSPKT
jgi:predicted GNAT superfamily acetyltransferase